MTVVGPWRDDSVPVWQQVGTASTADGSRTMQYQAEAGRTGASSAALWAETLHAAWNNEIPAYAGPGGVRSEWEIQDNVTNVHASFFVSWVTVERPTTTRSVGQLPLTVMNGGGSFVDPTVVGVEWEPTDLPIDQRLTVTVIGLNANNFVAGYQPGELAYVKLGQANPSPDPYGPGYLTGAAIAARGTLGTVTMGAPGNPTTFGQTVISDLPIDLTGDAALALTVIDSHTQTQIPPPYPAPPSTARRATSFRLTLESAYKPRYRLIYAELPTVVADVALAPPLRRFQRGDRQAIGGVPRLSQSRTRNASLRRGPHGIV